MDDMRKRLLAGLSFTNKDPMIALNVVVTNAAKIINKLETELTLTDNILNKQAVVIKKLNRRQADLEGDFAKIRLDLKSAMILHDEPYKNPPVDSISEAPKPSNTKSKKLKRLEKDNPLG